MTGGVPVVVTIVTVWAGSVERTNGRKFPNVGKAQDVEVNQSSFVLHSECTEFSVGSYSQNDVTGIIGVLGEDGEGCSAASNSPVELEQPEPAQTKELSRKHKAARRVSARE